MENIIVLQKGESIKFLDYTIGNSLNNDGLVLFKHTKDGGQLHECHLGNYGIGTQENIDFCKIDAILHFMIARPAKFAETLVRKMRKLNSGSMHEFYALKDACMKENIILPEEITCGDNSNAMIYFKGKPLAEEPIKTSVLSEEQIKILVKGFERDIRFISEKQ